MLVLSHYLNMLVFRFIAICIHVGCLFYCNIYSCWLLDMFSRNIESCMLLVLSQYLIMLGCRFYQNIKSCWLLLLSEYLIISVFHIKCLMFYTLESPSEYYEANFNFWRSILVNTYYIYYSKHYRQKHIYVSTISSWHSIFSCWDISC